MEPESQVVGAVWQDPTRSTKSPHSVGIGVVAVQLHEGFATSCGFRAASVWDRRG